MSRRKSFDLCITDLRNKYKQDFPVLFELADVSADESTFKEKLNSYVFEQMKVLDEKDKISHAAAIRILLLIKNDNKVVDELSTGQPLVIETITFLWRFLKGESEELALVDLYWDLYYQFKLLLFPAITLPTINIVKKYMHRWPDGLDPEVVRIRIANKNRIITKLITKIENRTRTASKYFFEEGISYDEKRLKVEDWWTTARFHLSMAVKSPAELNTFLDNSLSGETLELLTKAKKKEMPFFVTPYYLSLLNPGKDGYDDLTIRSYVLYSKELVDTYGEIRAWEKEDIVMPGEPNAAGWLLPEGNNIHRRYPEVAILIPDSMGRACGGLCASCQRMYDFQSERLNFNFEALKPKETWDKKLRRLMHYFEEDTQLRDILITGGDAFMSQNATLRKILEAVYQMAKRKRKANLLRPEGEKYAEIQRVRLGSRLLAYLPQRITPELIAILREFREKASRIGISQFYIQTHFQSPLEVTPEAKRAIEAILAAGWTITNQLVYTVAASRRGHTARLRQVLNRLGVVCYYTFSVKGFNENYAVFAPNSRSLQEEQEEKVLGNLTDEQKKELDALIRSEHPTNQLLFPFLKKNKLPFAGTDRNVLNLPAIGKSMTFRSVGITADGKRILKFDHDGSRRHSPIIDQMGEVYIVENKSIAAYLSQLETMGEKIEEYDSIWHYGEGVTEARFSIYHYPEYSFELTEKMTNLQL
ncbi:MAG: KamA family protein [Massilibacteroides sp.]|nr:KamA family protein [Massilibacteroides sp.]MDD3063848.1 KamA family protein [Massilibacteroides sp.]MDD4114257.1 KamA family protein [Massilibacteroides sp.]MDD4661039.1 KamA family protein [Massilibacteroides sp.]